MMRQAVVLIHGIGEQLPMGTLRPFVRNLLPDAKKGPAWYSKPDGMSELFELRRIQSRGRPRTDFYEYYWAYRVENTKLWDVGMWLGSLMLRRKKDVPQTARAIWRMSRLLTIIFVGLVLTGSLSAAGKWFEAQPKLGVAWLLIALGWLVAQFVLIAYLGDAARYLSPRPRNIKLRQAVRSDGLQLLKTLHKSGRYDRIILVGHSLGSVIGYDLIKHLWQDYNEHLDLENADIAAYVRRCLASGTPSQPIVRNDLSTAGGALNNADMDDSARAAALDAFQELQASAWREQRMLGNPWLITDFVTIGSPLAHAMLLMSGSANDFRDRIDERELVTCPPQRDAKGYAYGASKPVDVSDKMKAGSRVRFTPLLLHHAAPFAVTRWTNLYMPARWGFCGDLVGGRLVPGFGPGIRDVEVFTGRWGGLARHTPLAHTSYWRAADAAISSSGNAHPSIHALKRAIALDDLRGFSAARIASLLKAPRAAGSPAKSVPPVSPPPSSNEAAAEVAPANENAAPDQSEQG
jgi:hypothetical protein